MQLVGEAEHAGLLGLPAHVLPAAVDGGAQLRLAEAERRAEGDGVHAPLVLRAGERARAVDHDLAQLRGHGGTGAEDAGAERAHAAHQLLVHGERAKQRSGSASLAGGIHLASIAWTPGAYGACSGAMRGVWLTRIPLHSF